MEGNLGGLAQATHEQKECDQRGRLDLPFEAEPRQQVDGLATDAFRPLENVWNVQCAERGVGQHNPEQQADIGDAPSFALRHPFLLCHFGK